jgi:hypothetical protein
VIAPLQQSRIAEEAIGTISPLEWVGQFDDDYREAICCDVLAGLPHSLPKIFRSGLEPSDSIEYSDHASIVRRCGEVATERALFLLEPWETGVLRFQYRDAPNSVVTSPDEFAKAFDISRKHARDRMSRTWTHFQRYITRVVGEEVDYAALDGSNRRGRDRRHAIIYLACLGLRIPPLASLDDINHIAKDHLANVPILSKEEKLIVSLRYNMEDSAMPARGNLGQNTGYAHHRAIVVARNAMGRLVRHASDRAGETETGPYEQLPEDDPQRAVCLIRQALCNKDIQLMFSRIAKTDISVYEAIRAELACDVAAGRIRDELDATGDGYDYEYFVARMFKIVAQYCRLSDSVLAGKSSRNKDIILQLLQDTSELRAAGLKCYARVSGYVSPGDFREACRLNPDLSHVAMQNILGRSKYSFWQGIEVFRRDISDMWEKYRYNADIDRVVILRAATDSPHNSERGIRQYLSHLRAIREVFADDVNADSEAHRFYALQDMFSPTPDRAIDHVRSWKIRCREMQQRYRNAPEVDDDIIRGAALWEWNAELRILILLNKRYKASVSLYQSVSGNSLAFDSPDVISGNAIASDRCDPQEILEMQVEAEERLATILRSLSNLEEVEKRAVLAVYGVVVEGITDTDSSYEQICSELGTTDLVAYVQEIVIPKLRMRPS